MLNFNPSIHIFENKPKPKPLPTAAEEEKPVYTRNDKWSEDGLFCYYSGADCRNCTLHLNYGFHKDGPKACHQPAANAALLEKGVPFPQPKPVKPLSEKKKQPKVTKEELEELLREIPRILPKLDEPSIKHIVHHLNTGYEGGAYLGRTWGAENLHNHITKLVKKKIIRVEKKFQNNLYYLP